MPGGKRWRLLSACGMVGLITWAGCHRVIDEVTSREFRLRQLVSSPDPVDVLRNSNDGDARAKAMRRLKEPARSGGGTELQDEMVQILAKTAVEDPRPLCRLAAIETLGRFQDERAAPALLQAYHASRQFPTEIANAIRCAAMMALGGKDHAEGVELLCQVASTPKPETEKSAIELTGFAAERELAELLGKYDPDAQAQRDARLAAIRALGQSKAPRAIEVLLPLVDDRDVAIRDRAHEALQTITGRKNVDKSTEAWRRALSRRDP
ncbi:MAG: HEAT repeat domain-containing protein [Gemmataceae bacterium]|nr:HEAT repeat domain-containing protein [Gemmataceae bacterium]